MSRAASLAVLRDRIGRIERPSGMLHGVLPFGVAPIDRALPGGGLALGAVHEIFGLGADEEDGAAAAGFAAGIIARLGASPTSPSPSPRVKPAGLRLPPRRVPSLSPLKGGEGWGEVGGGSGIVLWCLKQTDLYGPGIAAHGLDPGRLVLVRAGHDGEILWALEEGLRAPGVAAVIGEIGRLPMVASRRLQLAAEHSGTTGFLLRRWRHREEAAAEREQPSAAMTRWRVAAIPSAPIIGEFAGEPGIGRPRWRAELLRCRGGAPAGWDVEVADATGHVSLSAELADRSTAPRRIAAEPLLRAS